MSRNERKFENHWQGRRSNGREWETVKVLRAMVTYKTQKNRYQLSFSLVINKVDLKNNNRKLYRPILNFVG